MRHQIHEIGIMRAILIISIVIGHVFAIYGISGSKSWTLPDGFDNIPYYSWVNTFFIGFSLQAFVFISGFLFERSVVESDIQNSKKKFIIKKIKRLLLPAMLFGAAYLIVIENVYPAEPAFYVSLINGPGHLWFLPMLMWCFLIGIFFYSFYHRYIFNRLFWFILIVICGVSIYPPPIRLITPRLFNAFYYFIFFMFGELCYMQKNKIEKWDKMTSLVLILITVGLLIVKYNLVPVDFGGKSGVMYLLNVVVGIIGSLALLKVCCYLKTYSSWVVLGSWGGFFGVYLVHQFVIKYLYYHTDFLVSLHIPGFAIPIITLVITLGISYIICMALMRFKITRKLI